MPDLLITDVRLGVYNGLQLLMRGRMVNPQLQAIVITGTRIRSCAARPCICMPNTSRSRSTPIVCCRSSATPYGRRPRRCA